MWRGTHLNEQLGSGAEPYGALKVQLAYAGRDAANEAFNLGDLIIITRSDSSFELFSATRGGSPGMALCRRDSGGDRK